MSSINIVQKYHMGWKIPFYIKISGNEIDGFNAIYINNKEIHHIFENGNPENAFIFKINAITDKNSEYLQYPFEKYYKKNEINNSNSSLKCYIRNNLNKKKLLNLDSNLKYFIEDILKNRSEYKKYVELSKYLQEIGENDKDKISVSIKKLC